MALSARCALCAALLLGACSERSAEPAAAPASAPAAQTAAASFTDRVWKVSASSAVAPGTLYEFRSDGTLVITTPGSAPALGSWTQQTPGSRELVMVEEGQRYHTEILALGDDEFRIRSHNPGEPVEISLVPLDRER